MAARAVVLGGSGFVGGHVCAALAGAGYRVTAVARRPAAGVDSVPLDLTDPHALDALGDLRPDVVVNAAGAVWRAGQGEMAALNVDLVHRLIVALDARPARLVQIGSVHEYGPVPAGVSITESSPARPLTRYGRTKLLATEAVLASGLDALVLRGVNAVGPGAPIGSLLGDAAARLADAVDTGDPVVLRLDRPDLRRDFVDVRDLADAVVAAVRAPVRGRVINIGRGTAVAVGALLAGLLAVSGVRAEVRSGPGPDPVAGDTSRPDAVNGAGIDWQQVDVRAARALLGWVPRRSLDESLRDLWMSARTPSAFTMKGSHQ